MRRVTRRRLMTSAAASALVPEATRVWFISGCRQYGIADGTVIRHHCPSGSDDKEHSIPLSQEQGPDLLHAAIRSEPSRTTIRLAIDPGRVVLSDDDDARAGWVDCWRRADANFRLGVSPPRHPRRTHTAVSGIGCHLAIFGGAADLLAGRFAQVGSVLADGPERGQARLKVHRSRSRYRMAAPNRGRQRRGEAS